MPISNQKNKQTNKVIIIIRLNSIRLFMCKLNSTEANYKVSTNG
jgi:hypothetical protein